jgi:hypothetical protein
MNLVRDISCGWCNKQTIIGTSRRQFSGGRVGGWEGGEVRVMRVAAQSGTASEAERTKENHF